MSREKVQRIYLAGKRFRKIFLKDSSHVNIQLKLHRLRVHIIVITGCLILL